MSTLLALTGQIVSIGDLPADDAPHIVGLPHIMVRLDDGRDILISGLTQDECRACVPGLWEAVSIGVNAP